MTQRQRTSGVLVKMVRLTGSLIFGTRVAQEEVEDEVALTLFINEVAEKMASVAISPEQWVELIEESNEGV